VPGQARYLDDSTEATAQPVTAASSR
jgi:hypothetical protein